MDDWSLRKLLEHLAGLMSRDLAFLVSEYCQCYRSLWPAEMEALYYRQMTSIADPRIPTILELFKKQHFTWVKSVPSSVEYPRNSFDEKSVFKILSSTGTTENLRLFLSTRSEKSWSQNKMFYMPWSTHLNIYSNMIQTLCKTGPALFICPLRWNLNELMWMHIFPTCESFSAAMDVPSNEPIVIDQAFGLLTTFLSPYPLATLYLLPWTVIQDCELFMKEDFSFPLDFHDNAAADHFCRKQIQKVSKDVEKYLSNLTEQEWTMRREKARLTIQKCFFNDKYVSEEE